MRLVWERYGTLVHTYCVRAIGDRELAADCVQETFVSVWRSRDRFDDSRGACRRGCSASPATAYTTPTGRRPGGTPSSSPLATSKANREARWSNVRAPATTLAAKSNTTSSLGAHPEVRSSAIRAAARTKASLGAELGKQPPRMIAKGCGRSYSPRVPDRDSLVTMPGGLTPEQQARVEIDRKLEAAGWVVQDFKEMDLSAARGVAVREFPTATGPADYLLYGDRKALGTIEAKKDGTPLLGVESQSDRYTEGFSQTAAKQKRLPAWRLPLPFHYMSTGKETYFANRLDPDYAPREVFNFHRPETLIEIAKSGETMRQQLRQMPPLIEEGLRQNQVAAIKGLEKSFASNHLRTLTPQTMGSGKTMLSCAQAYRLLRYGGAEANPLPGRPDQPRRAGPARVPQLRHARRRPQARRALQRPAAALEPDRPGGQRRHHDDPAALLDAPRRGRARPRAGGGVGLRASAAASTTWSSCRSATSRRSRSSCSTSSSPTSAIARSTAAGARSSTTSTPSWSG